MKKRFIICLLFTALLITSLSGCTSGSEFATKYVQGALDAVYLAQFDAEYLELLHDATAEDLQSAYLATLEERPDYFASYFDIAILTDEMRAELVELYREIYLHARYEVRGAEKTENGYLVEVVIEPKFLPTKPPFNFEDELPIMILLAQPYILPSSLFMPVIPPQTSVPLTKRCWQRPTISVRMEKRSTMSIICWAGKTTGTRWGTEK